VLDERRLVGVVEDAQPCGRAVQRRNPQRALGEPAQLWPRGEVGPALQVRVHDGADAMVPVVDDVIGRRDPPAVQALHLQMRGLMRLRSAELITARHAFVQNLRRGHYEFVTDVPPPLRLASHSATSHWLCDLRSFQTNGCLDSLDATVREEWSAKSWRRIAAVARKGCTLRLRLVLGLVSG
jgi:hypothetical protein